MNYNEYFKKMFRLSSLERLYGFYTVSKSIDRRSETYKIYSGLPVGYEIPSEFATKNEDGISLVDLACMCSGTETPELLIYLWQNYNSLNTHEEVDFTERKTTLYEGYCAVLKSPSAKIAWQEEITKFSKKPSIKSLARLYGICLEVHSVDMTNTSMDIVKHGDIKLAMDFFELRTGLLDIVLTNKEELNKSTKIRLGLDGSIAKLKILDAEKKFYSNKINKTT